MKTNQSVTQTSTYALLVRSEEKERSLFEVVAYGLTVLSVVAAIWQFAAQPVKLPATLSHTASIAQVEDVSRS
ncbi:MAG: hypothetical protein V7609_498 [Verrucomicrobiota bacterium]